MTKSTTTTDTETDTDAVHTRAFAPRVPTLTIVHHPDERFLGERFVLGNSRLELGRESTPFGEGALAHARISRRHARVGVDQGNLLVEDLGSRNGTSINGVAIDRASAVAGDVIEMGPILFLFHVAEALYALPKCARIMGKSAAIAGVLAAIDAVAKHATTILVHGETGTGKELVAREIHDRSGRPGAFVAINCASMPAGILQSELFGHERGAFSGATHARKGLFEVANEGTLLLDEIGDAPPDLQVALLRVLQEREVRPLGASRPLPVTTRVVAATHQKLEKLVAAGRFREDLWARLTPWVIDVPPLADRPEDIPILANGILRRLGESRRLHRSAMLALVRGSYPRNVRQLEAAVERMVREAKPGERDLHVTESARALLAPPRRAQEEAPREEALPREPREPREPRDKESLERLLREHDGNVTRAADKLGIGRNTLYRWLRQASVSLGDARESNGHDD